MARSHFFFYHFNPFHRLERLSEKYIVLFSIGAIVCQKLGVTWIVKPCKNWRLWTWDFEGSISHLVGQVFSQLLYRPTTTTPPPLCSLVWEELNLRQSWAELSWAVCLAPWCCQGNFDTAPLTRRCGRIDWLQVLTAVKVPPSTSSIEVAVDHIPLSYSPSYRLWVGFLQFKPQPSRRGTCSQQVPLLQHTPFCT